MSVQTQEVERQLWETARATAALNQMLGKFYGDRLIAQHEKFRSDIKELLTK